MVEQLQVDPVLLTAARAAVLSAAADRLAGLGRRRTGGGPTRSRQPAPPRCCGRSRDLTVGVTIGRRPDSPQVVVEAVTRCLRNGG